MRLPMLVAIVTLSSALLAENYDPRNPAEAIASFETKKPDQQRFLAYEANYLLPAYARKDDGLMLAGKLSMQYMISDCEYSVEVRHKARREAAPVCFKINDAGLQPQWIFTYTNEFDFYT